MPGAPGEAAIAAVGRNSAPAAPIAIARLSSREVVRVKTCSQGRYEKDGV
jgi:hypothetical protein